MRTSRALRSKRSGFLRLGRIEAGEQGWQGIAWAIERIYPHRFARPEVMNQRSTASILGRLANVKSSTRYSR
jgi:hypothetical protein